jgi:NNP family nitrate/nitrite transporter-like MFS transporter
MMAMPTTGAPARQSLVLATVSFTLSFAAWGLIGGLASIFTELYHLTASQTALLVAVPVLLGSLARLPMGMLTIRACSFAWANVSWWRTARSVRISPVP